VSTEPYDARDVVGRTSGWTVDEDPEGGFRWSADGPTGTLQGHAETRDEAEQAAREAEQRLIEEHELERRRSRSSGSEDGEAG
jgi:predicted RNase H-like HicB family nuclease